MTQLSGWLRCKASPGVQSIVLLTGFNRHQRSTSQEARTDRLTPTTNWNFSATCTCACVRIVETCGLHIPRCWTNTRTCSGYTWCGAANFCNNCFYWDLPVSFRQRMAPRAWAPVSLFYCAWLVQHWVTGVQHNLTQCWNAGTGTPRRPCMAPPGQESDAVHLCHRCIKASVHNYCQLYHTQLHIMFWYILHTSAYRTTADIRSDRIPHYGACHAHFMPRLAACNCLSCVSA